MYKKSHFGYFYCSVHNSWNSFDQNEYLNYGTQYLSFRTVKYSKTFQIKPKSPKKYQNILFLEAFLVIFPQYNLFLATSVQWRDWILRQFNEIAINIDGNIKIKTLWCIYITQTFKISYIKPNFCCFNAFHAQFFHNFISIFHYDNSNELSSSKWVSIYAWTEHRWSNFKYLQNLAIFGTFWLLLGLKNALW